MLARKNTETGLSCLYCSGAVHRLYLQGKFYQHVPVLFFPRTKQHHSERHIINNLLIADTQIWTPFSLLQSTWAASFIFPSRLRLRSICSKVSCAEPCTHASSNSEISGYGWCLVIPGACKACTQKGILLPDIS